MASAKIATLVIRTLAKPIATQLKQQASQHETFRKLCISLAQFMHRTELRLRQGLGPASAGGQKVRPLNDAKAIANGANSLSEGFLFLVAAALILGESYRGSRSRARQRDSTEAAVEEVRIMVETLSKRLGVQPEELKPVVVQGESEEEVPHLEPPQGDPTSPASNVADSSLRRQEAELAHLRAAVRVLLQMALREGWVDGEEGLRLNKVLRGEDDADEEPAVASNSKRLSTEHMRRSDSQGPDSRPSVTELVAQERVKAIVDEIRNPVVPSAGPSASKLFPSSTQTPFHLRHVAASPILHYIAMLPLGPSPSPSPFTSPSIPSPHHLSYITTFA